MIIKLKNGDKIGIRRMQTAAGGPLFPWLLNTEWIDNWKFRTTPASRSRVLSGKGVETDKQYTERRKKETTKRTWRSNAADIAHGIGEGVLALHPYTAIPYFGAKVGLDFLNGTYGWHTALNASVPLFHLAPQAVGLREATNVALEDAANAGSKTAKTYLISRELKSTIKKGLKPAPSKTDKHPYDINDIISNYNSGKQNLESWWLDRELTTGDPNKLVHFDNGDFKPHFWKHDIHGNKVKGAYINDGKLIPSGEGELLRLWWSPGKPFLDSHFRYEQSSNWGLPKRYITVDRNAGDFELMYYSDPITMRPIPGDEILSNGPVDLSNASIIQKSPFGWWERVKSTPENRILLSTPSKQLRVVSEGTYPWYRGKLHSINEVVNPDVKVLPKRIITDIPEEKISTLSWNHATKLADNDKLITLHNLFALQYGYPELPYTLASSNRRTNQAIRKTIARHNSFYRGVNPQMATKEDKLHYMESLKEGEQPTVQGFIKFAATTPRSNGAGIFVSPFSANSSIYGNGTTNLVRRPYKLSKDRMNWFKEGDFEVLSIYDSKKDLSGHPVLNPWEVIRYPFTPKPNNGTVPANELVLFNKLHYVGPRTYKATGETTNKTNVTLIHRKGGRL